MAPPPNPRTRRLNPCHRHPNLPTTTGLCAPCLRDRLSLLSPSPSSQPSTSTSLPEFRRSKSFSANNPAGIYLDPGRRSCGILSTLFHIDDHDGDGNVAVSDMHEFDGLARVSATRECDFDVNVARVSNTRGINSEIRVSDMHGLDRASDMRECDFDIDVACVAVMPEIECEIDVPRASNNVDDFEEGKTIKEFIDLECKVKTNKVSNRRDFKEIAGSFLIAASVFSKKLRKWRKEGTRRHNDRGIDRLGDSQSEVGEYGCGRRSCDIDPRASIDLGRASLDVGAFGRRSCDSDPRFSIDLGRASIDCGRISVDEGRCSLDAPRASWDGYLMGGRALPRATPMVSVIENAMATVYGFDHRMLSEGKMKVENRVARDSNRVHLHNQKISIDECSFLKKDIDVTVVKDVEPKLLSAHMVSPAKLVITEKELNSWRLNSLKDDSSESFETASKDFASVSSSNNGKVFKKCRQWSKLWNVWGLLNPKKGEKYGQERLERGNQECPHPESSYNTQSNANEAKLVRSHSTSSSRGSSKALVRRRKENVFDRNRSARFSPNHVDNGLLRFYLTPLRSRRQTKPGKAKLNKSHSLARSVLRL